GQSGRDPRGHRARAWRGPVHATTRPGHRARTARGRTPGHDPRRRRPRPGAAARPTPGTSRQSGPRRASKSRTVRDHLYLDSSALVKLVVLEPESVVLRDFLRAYALRVSSALAEVEVPRALLRAGYGAREGRRAVQVLSRIALIETDR